MIDRRPSPDDPRALLCVEVAGPVSGLEITACQGAGATVSFTLGGSRHTFDLFPAAGGAPQWLQDALDSAGAVLSIRIEDGGTTTASRTAGDHNDLFAAPTPLRLVEVPDPTQETA